MRPLTAVKGLHCDTETISALTEKELYIACSDPGLITANVIPLSLSPCFLSIYLSCLDQIKAKRTQKNSCNDRLLSHL